MVEDSRAQTGMTTEADVCRPESAVGSRRAAYRNYMSSTLLGRHLASEGLISREQLQQALKRQHRGGEPLGQVLIDEHLIGEAQLQSALQAQKDGRERCESSLLEGAGRETMQQSIPPWGREAADSEDLRQRLSQRTRLGELLWRAGIVTRKQIAAALRRQKKTREKIGGVLVSMGSASIHAVRAALGLQKKAAAVSGHDRRLHFDGLRRRLQQLRLQGHAGGCHPLGRSMAKGRESGSGGSQDLFQKRSSRGLLADTPGNGKTGYRRLRGPQYLALRPTPA